MGDSALHSQAERFSPSSIFVLSPPPNFQNARHNLRPQIVGSRPHRPDDLKINPQHNVPALVDGDFKLNESRAIALYLVNAHGKDNKLYPTEAKARAIVDQRMYFDMGNFYDKFGQCVYPLAFGAADKLGEDKVTKFEEVLGWVNGWVEGTVFADGPDQLTLADICF